MLIKRSKTSDLKEHQVTDEKLYLERRQYLKKMGFLGVGSLLSGATVANVFNLFGDDSKTDVFKQRDLNYQIAKASTEVLTPEIKVTTHNNLSLIHI